MKYDFSNTKRYYKYGNQAKAEILKMTQIKVRSSVKDFFRVMMLYNEKDLL